MKASSSKKRIVVLPEEFQEVLISHELKLSKNAIDVDLIRHLIYLYSLGMEYYDSQNKTELQQFYFQKCNKFLQLPIVIETLDKNSVNLKEFNNIKLFQVDPYQVVYSSKQSKNTDCMRRTITEEDTSNLETGSSYTEFFNETPVYSDKLLKRRSTISSKIEEKQIVKNKIKDEVDILYLKLEKLNENMKNSISEQASKFEIVKKQKIEHKNSMKNIKNLSHKLKDEQITNYSSNCSRLWDDEIFRETNTKIQKDDRIQSMMNKEIEDYIEKNMSEMTRALEDIKLSFEDEINSIDEIMFPDLIKGLKEDMCSDLENLKDQYEEKRRCEIEKIRAKYNINKEVQGKYV